MTMDNKGITSVINKAEVIANTQRKFGASVVYYPCYITDSGDSKFALFTERELDLAISRGEANLEDVVIMSSTNSMLQKIKSLLMLKLW